MRSHVEEALAKGETVVLDFAGLPWVRMGFLDEMLGVWIFKPQEGLAERLKVEGMSERVRWVKEKVERARREWWERTGEKGRDGVE